MDSIFRDRAFSTWPKEKLAELAEGRGNGNVGTSLVSETDQVRIWHLILQPGETMPFHTHVLDYFWTVLTDGKGRSHYGDGAIDDIIYCAGDTKHRLYNRHQSMTHDLENVGDTPLMFVTVEFKQGVKQPLKLIR